MSRVLDIDPKIELWIPALEAVEKDEPPICPRCNSNDVGVQAEVHPDGIGYALITCNKCGKSGYFSRVMFKHL